MIVGAYLMMPEDQMPEKHIFILAVQAMNNIADVTLTGAAASDQFGFSVSTAGDVNGDGYSDVIVGAYIMMPEEQMPAEHTFILAVQA